MVELLFARLSPELRRRAMKQVTRFVCTSSLPSVMNEASIIANAAVWAAPDEAAEVFLPQLFSRIQEELPRRSIDGTARLSKASAIA